MSTYNGWTNYATWRINLEIFDGMDCTDIPMLSRYSEPDPHEVAEYLKEYVQEILDTDCDPSRLANAYANAFISDVNWYEIAMHFVHTWNDIIAEENQDD
ncbi:MAG: hypothetical protein EBU08_17455 [Micrococcales bacterium]|nr:hypothetical protein [Micrococcales bacterium]